MPAPSVATCDPAADATAPALQATQTAAALSYQARLTTGTGTGTGHGIRMRRILNPKDGRTVIVPLDHGMLLGPVPGIANPRNAITHAIAAHADAILLHAGLARHVADLYGGRAAGLFKLTNGASVGTDQWLLGSIEQALQCAADAVCVEFHLGAPDEMRTLHDIGVMQREAERYGLPVIIHAYVYPAYEEKIGIAAWLHASRIAVELGADMVKTAYLGDTRALAELLEATPVPVVVAGGAEGSVRQLFADITTALRLGVAGIAIGRRAWGAENPGATMAALGALVHEAATVDDVLVRYNLA